MRPADTDFDIFGGDDSYDYDSTGATYRLATYSGKLGDSLTLAANHQKHLIATELGTHPGCQNGGTQAVKGGSTTARRSCSWRAARWGCEPFRPDRYCSFVGEPGGPAGTRDAALRLVGFAGAVATKPLGISVRKGHKHRPAFSLQSETTELESQRRRNGI